MLSPQVLVKFLIISFLFLWYNVSVEELSHYVFKNDLFIIYSFMIVVLTLPR